MIALAHPALPRGARVWGAGRPAYPDEPPAASAVEAGTRAWREAGVDAVVSLIEDWEIPRRAPGLFAALERQGVDLLRFPIADFGAPVDASGFATFLEGVHRRLAAGAGVLVHCNAGLGRTAVVLAALLRRSGFAGDPVAEIRRIYQPAAMQSPVQEAFARDFPVGASR